MSRRGFIGVAAAGLAATRSGLAVPLLSPASAQAMNTRPIPSTGEALPVVGLGTWQTFDVAASDTAPLREVLRLFADGGGRMVDSSPMYGRSEQVVGTLSQDLGLLGELFFATKVWTRGQEEGIRQMRTSMEHMGVDTMDLMQVHNLLDVDRHLATLREWREEGRIRYLGITHYQVGAHDRLEALIRSHDLDFVQLNYSLAVRDAERSLLPAAAERGTAVIVNRPFEGGSLFRTVRGRTLPDWASEFDCESWGQFFLKYILAAPEVTCVIPATSNPEHLVDNLGAGRGRLPDATLRRRMVEWMTEGVRG